MDTSLHFQSPCVRFEARQITSFTKFLAFNFGVSNVKERGEPILIWLSLCHDIVSTPAFKMEQFAACQQPWTSIVALASSHGMSANVLHRWLKAHARTYSRQPRQSITAPQPLPAAQAFIPRSLRQHPRLFGRAQGRVALSFPR